MKNKKEKVIERFTNDMDNIGLDVEPYMGRGYYDGVGVVTDDPQSAYAGTSLLLNSDSLGMQTVLYPVLEQDLPSSSITSEDVLYTLMVAKNKVDNLDIPPDEKEKFYQIMKELKDDIFHLLQGECQVFEEALKE